MVARPVSTTVNVDVEVDLDDFDNDDLIQELLLRGVLTRADVDELDRRHSLTVEPDFPIEPADLQGPWRREALITLERWLGSAWNGLFSS